MSESMVERVRHAISSTEGCNEDGRPCVKCDDLTFPGCAVLARAAIAAMREPTDGMLAAEITDEHRMPRVYQWSELEEPNVLRRARQHIWHAMIGEALKPD